MHRFDVKHTINVLFHISVVSMRKPVAPTEIFTWPTSVTAARDVTCHTIVDRNLCFIDKARLNAMHQCNVSFVHFHSVVEMNYVLLLLMPFQYYLNQVTEDSYPNRVSGCHNQYLPVLFQPTEHFLLETEKKGIFDSMNVTAQAGGPNPLHNLGIGNLIFSA